MKSINIVGCYNVSENSKIRASVEARLIKSDADIPFLKLIFDFPHTVKGYENKNWNKINENMGLLEEWCLGMISYLEMKNDNDIKIPDGYVWYLIVYVGVITIEDYYTLWDDCVTAIYNALKASRVPEITNDLLMNRNVEYQLIETKGIVPKSKTIMLDDNNSFISILFDYNTGNILNIYKSPGVALKTADFVEIQTKIRKIKSKK